MLKPRSVIIDGHATASMGRHAAAMRAVWTAAHLEGRALGVLERGSTRAFGSSASRHVADSSSSSSSGSSSDESPPDVRSSFQYCVQRVRQHDYESYLCTLALPKERRLPAMALRAFNVETAQALGATKEPHLALMRLRWWKDAVASAAGRPDAVPPSHPVAIALHSALHASTPGGVGARHKRWLDALVDARIKDAEHVGPPPGVPFLEAYANSTASSLLLLLMDTCGVRDSDADHAAAHLGKAIGIANLLRGTHAHSAQRRCYLPADVQARHGASTEDVYRARPTEEVRNAVHEVASVAKAHLDSARAMEPRLQKAGADGGKTAKAVLLPAVGVGKYLEALEAKDFDVFHPELVRGVNPIVTQGRIAWAAFRGTY